MAHQGLEPGGVGRVIRLGAVFALAALGLAACASVGSRGPAGYAGAHGTDKPYQVDGRWYYPHAQPGYDEVGAASWYGQQFHNHHTADGEIFDQYGLSAAHKTLPLPCMVEVTNLDNGRRIKLRVNDRGPFADGRILDVSRAAADALGFRGQGLARVRVRYLGPATALAAVSYARQDAPPPSAPPRPIRLAQAQPASTSADEDPEADAPEHEPSSAPAAPVAADAAPPAAAAAAASGAYAVQAAAFANRDNAERAVSRLGAVGAASIRAVTTSQGARLYRVVVSGYADAGAAEAARSQIAAAGYGDARVIAAD